MKIVSLFCIAAVSMFCSCGQNKNAGTIPVISEVGDTRLPEEIAPVEAPFNMPQPARPSFPDTTVRLSLREAPQGMQTAYINRQIEELSRAGGGTVLLDSGVWQAGRIELKNNINLHVPSGTEIHFSGAVADYRPAVFTRMEGTECLSAGAFIYADHQENIALTGRGLLVSPALDCELCRCLKESNKNHKHKKITHDMPLNERLFDGTSQENSMFLPKTFSPINCRNVLVEGIRTQGSLTWNLVPVYCENVIIRGVNVNSVGVPTGDGIDIESTRNVLIEYCTLSNGDDCFTVKAGRCEDGLRVNKPSENIVVRYCLAEKGHGGITCGSETAGSIRHLYVHDCVFNGTDRGLRFKTRRDRAGGGDSLYYERIRIVNAKEAMRWDMLGAPFFMGELASRTPVRAMTPLTPHFRDIFVRDIAVENSENFIRVSGIPESPASGVYLENCHVSCKKLPEFTDVDGFVIKNSSITAQDSVIKLVDARNITFDNVKLSLGGKLIIRKEGNTEKSIRFLNRAG